MRLVASRTGGVVSHSTVHQALSGKRIPRWGALELIIEALGGDPENFHSLWKEVRAEARGIAVESASSAGAVTDYRFRMERVDSYGVSVQDYLSSEQARKIKESNGTDAALAFLESRINGRWTSTLVGDYLSLLEESKRHDKIAENMPRLRGISMSSASAAHSVASAFDPLEEFVECARHEKVALRLDPNNAIYAWYTGSYLASADMDDEAHVYYEVAYSLDPTVFNHVESYIESLVDRSDLTRAGFVAREALRVIRNNSHLQLLAGNVLALQGDFSEAEVILRSVSKPSASRDRALAQVLMALGKGGEALELLATRWQQDPDDLESGVLYAELLREADSSEQFEAVLMAITERVERLERRGAGLRTYTG
ncbi:tetratricopeptide repeat protein [Streptomyces sp. NPDC018031]|uniref:tetratricopeptide repeat protein n=1 Tax=Streptomyces sp. NPDC018031 TaxID=3365033 RepID=UPI0037AF0C9E